MAVEGVPQTFQLASNASSIPYLADNIWGVLTLICVFSCVTFGLTSVYGFQLYRKTGDLGDFAVWKK